MSHVIAVPTALTRRTTREQAAIAMLAIGGSATAFFSVLAMRAEGDAAVTFDNVQQLVAIVAAIGALLIVRSNADGEQRRVHGALALALALGSIGFLIWDSMPSPTAASIAADAFLLAATVIAVVGVGTTIFRGLDRPMVAAVALDTLIFVLGVITAVLMVWNRSGGPAGGDASPSALIGAVILYSAAAAGVIGLIARRIKPSVRGPWLVVVGVYAIGSSWLFWLDGAARGGGSLITPADFLFSVGVLIAAFGGATWATPRSVSPVYEQIARRAADLFPILAVIAAAALELVPRRTSGMDVVTVFASATMLAAMGRQGLLLRAERSARDAERKSSGRLAREIEERAATIVMLSRLEPGDTPEATAQRICEEALRLDGIDFAVVRAFDRAGRVFPLASSGMDLGGTVALGEPIDAARGAITVERAVAGPWVEILAPNAPVLHLRALHGSGLRGTANAPMRWEDRLIGAVGLGTCSEETAAWLSERLPMVREFGVVAAGLLGPALAARERRARLRQDLQGVIDREAFRPVYQVVKELATGRVIGFEALTRFADGTPPDLKFNEAVAAGLGLELEQACLTASIRAATALPPGAWLSLNVSPALALAVEPLVALLRATDRDLVLEITEHAPIEDYPRLADALVTLRHHARLAVDDAGAGYAGLRHILEVQPQFVKLDISLVRAVDKDAARRAMIGGMVAFARDAGCALIAEGIETPGELATLQELGVRFGQGYLLGRPAPVDAIDLARPGRRPPPVSAGSPTAELRARYGTAMMTDTQMTPGSAKGRHLRIPGTRNLRDVGGYPASGGRRTRWRTLYRTDALDVIPPASQDALLDLGLRTVIDLRWPHELKVAPSVFATSTGVRYRSIPLLDNDPTPVIGLAATYRQILDERASQLAEVVRVLLATDALPAVIGCAAGKDRTGVAIAVLLSAVGVAPDVIIADYVLTGRAFSEPDPDDAHFLDWRAGPIDLDCRPEHMQAMLVHLADRHGGAGDLLRRQGLSQADLDLLVERLTEPTSD